MNQDEPTVVQKLQSQRDEYVKSRQILLSQQEQTTKDLFRLDGAIGALDDAIKEIETQDESAPNG